MLAERNLSALRYPRSFLGLLVAAFLIVALPLIGTLLYSAWHTERLTEQSRSAVSGASASRLHKTLISQAAQCVRIDLNNVSVIEVVSNDKRSTLCLRALHATSPITRSTSRDVPALPTWL